MIPASTKIRLSHTALDLFLTCERKFQLNRLLVGAPEKQDYPATVLGKAFGVGVASYLLHRDSDLALLETWKAYYPKLEDAKRTEAIALNLVLASIPSLDMLLDDWEVATINGKPAVELSFRLDIDNRFYFVGYVDLVLRNIHSGSYAILEVKTTAMNLLSLDPLYQNSGQALGYSIVLDRVVGKDQSDYDVIYFVGQLGSGNGFAPKISTLVYPKTLSDRLNWFISLGMDVERMGKMIELNVFPLRGASCLSYMKPCYHLGTCGMHALDRYKEEEEDTIEYQFVYNLDDVIEDHLERMK